MTKITWEEALRLHGPQQAAYTREQAGRRTKDPPPPDPAAFVATIPVPEQPGEEARDYVNSATRPLHQG